MPLFRKSGSDVTNRFGRKSAIPAHNFGSKLNIGKPLSQRMDEFGKASQKKSDLEKGR